ncbi:hypothetical protein PanWU01x14_167280, partial [Parasponia andersonii]
MKTTKGGSSVAEYMQKIKNVIDDLPMIGHPLSDKEAIAHALNGLVDKFDQLSTAIRHETLLQHLKS